MKIRLLNDVAGAMGVWKKGEVREAEMSFATALIQVRAAEPVEKPEADIKETAAVEPAEVAVGVPTEKRKVGGKRK